MGNKLIYDNLFDTIKRAPSDKLEFELDTSKFLTPFFLNMYATA